MRIGDGLLGNLGNLQKSHSKPHLESMEILGDTQGQQQFEIDDNFELLHAPWSWNLCKLRVSDPRTAAYFHFEVPFESSNLPGSEPLFPQNQREAGRWL